MAVNRAAHKSYDHKSRAEKLGLQPGQTAVVVGIADPHFIAELQQHGVRISSAAPADLIFCGVESRAAFSALAGLAKRMKRDGALWTIRPKGSPHLSEADVMKAGKAAGLVDVKVVRFSETHTAEKFVIPKKDR